MRVGSAAARAWRNPTLAETRAQATSARSMPVRMQPWGCGYWTRYMRVQLWRCWTCEQYVLSLWMRHE
jgi:hypothetical protein